MDEAPENVEASKAPVPGDPPSSQQPHAKDPVATSSILPPEIAEKLPPELRQSLEFSMMTMGPMPAPYAQHITGDHIHKLIDNAEKESVRDHERQTAKLVDRRHNRVTACLMGLAVLVIAGVIFGTLPKDRVEGFQEIAKAVGFVVAGGIGGYGYATKKFGEKED